MGRGNPSASRPARSSKGQHGRVVSAASQPLFHLRDLGAILACFTVYYYTEDRPDAHTVSWHNTEYVEPPLPARFVTGYALTDQDARLLDEAIVRRDSRIELLYRIRAEADGKYAHVWNQYEYYLNLSRSLRDELDSMRAAAQAGEGAQSGPPQSARASSPIRAVRALRDRVTPARPIWRRSTGR